MAGHNNVFASPRNSRGRKSSSKKIWGSEEQCEHSLPWKVTAKVEKCWYVLLMQIQRPRELILSPDWLQSKIRSSSWTKGSGGMWNLGLLLLFSETWLKWLNWKSCKEYGKPWEKSESSLCSGTNACSLPMWCKKLMGLKRYCPVAIPSYSRAVHCWLHVLHLFCSLRSRSAFPLYRSSDIKCMYSNTA